MQTSHWNPLQSLEKPSLNRRLKEGGFYTTVEVARRYEREGVVCLVILHALLAATILRYLPPYVLLVVPVLYARVILGGHEVLHSKVGLDVNPLTRLMPFYQTPIVLGYEQIRDIHLRHHRFFGTKDDPEDYLVTAPSHLRALGLAFISPERHYLRYVQARGMTKRLAVETLIRAALFVGMLCANPAVFLIHVAIMRVTMGGSEFFFHNVIHMADLEKRDRWFYERVPKVWWRMLRGLFGTEKVDILLVHDTHHAHQLISAAKLEDARQLIASGREWQVNRAG